MDRQPETREPLEHLEGLRLAPVALVHVRLDPEDVDVDAGVETVLDEALVVRRDVEVVEQQRRARVGGAGRLERRLDDPDLAKGLAHAGHAVLVPVEDRHDHGLVDDVPRVDHAVERRDLAFDASELGGDRVRGRELKQPGGGLGVPAQRMALDDAAAIDEPLRRGQESLGVGAAPDGLEPGPVERQRGEVEQAQPVPGALLGRRPVGVGHLVVRERDELGARAAEREGVAALADDHLLAGQWLAVGTEHGDRRVRGAVLPDQRVDRVIGTEAEGCHRAR